MNCDIVFDNKGIKLLQVGKFRLSSDFANALLLGYGSKSLSFLNYYYQIYFLLQDCFFFVLKEIFTYMLHTGVARRAFFSSVEVKNIGSAGCADFILWMVVRTVSKS